MSPLQALVWFTCWAAWTLGSLQFYCLPFTLSNIAKYLDVKQSKISEANTTAMLSRSVGAVIFGVLSDQYGRKIPMLINIVCLGVLTLASGFIKTYPALIGVRFTFGAAYGGIYGLVMATVLEATPRKARGIVGGFTQQGFAAGYLLCSAFHLAMSKYEWQALFFLAAGLTVPIFVLRIFTPSYSTTAAAVKDDNGPETHVSDRAAVGGNLSFIKKLKYVMRYHYGILIYLIILTACFNTMGHGTFDLYPTFLTTQRKLSVQEETWVTIILQSGGIIGAMIGGYLGKKYSLKWIPFCFAIFAGPWLPLYALPKSWHLLALGAFFAQFGYGGAIGNLGNILQEICPHPGLRASFGGVAYNLGNAISSIAPTVETKLGETYSLPDGTPDYARTQLILVGIMDGLLVLTLALMPKKSLNKDWDMEDPNAEIPHQAENILLAEGIEDKGKTEAGKASEAGSAEVVQIENKV
ncbi:major facilitator superfamily domain-containing protein [Xylogone sp. PMI_703]|nr:major facilitator superfamily domain-containing protein [Xylogone sp. PMI_703]